MALRFPSLDVIVSGARHALARFPVAFVFVAAAAVTAHLWVADAPGSGVRYFRWVALLGGAAAMAFALTLRLEIRGVHRRCQWLVGLGLAALVALLHFVAPPFRSPQGVAFLSQWIVLVAVVLVLAPFSRRREVRGFWRHGQTVVDRALLAGIFSGAACLGLTLAAIALEGLFGLKIPRGFYAHLTVSFGLVVAPWIVLGAYPKDTASLNVGDDIPRALRFFAQWVMLPLVSVYALILLAYAAQIAVRGQWPKGTVGWLVSWAGVLGIATNLVLLPLAERHEFAWVRRFLRVFYAGLVVFAVLLALALFRRVSEYGWTEDRVLLGLVTVWFFGLAVAFTLRPNLSRQWVPASLGGLVLVTLFGPLSPARIAMRDQTRRLEALMARLGAHARSVPTRRFEVEERASLWRQLDFFDDRDLLPSILDRFPPLTLAPGTERATIADVMGALGQSREHPGLAGRTAEWRIALVDESLAVTGMDHVVEVQPYRARGKDAEHGAFAVGHRRWRGKTDGKVLRVEDLDGRLKASFDLSAWHKGIADRNLATEVAEVRLTGAEATIANGKGEPWTAVLLVRSGWIRKDSGDVNVVSAWLAFRELAK